jgi:hypothetical protein
MAPRIEFWGDSEMCMSEGERAMWDAVEEEEESQGTIEQMAADRLDHIDAPKGYWNSTAGPIAIERMTDSHLRNALRWLDKYGIDGTPKGLELLAEQERRAHAKKVVKKAKKAWPPPSGSLKRHSL